MRRQLQMSRHGTCETAENIDGVADDLAAMTAALKEIVYDFCQYAERTGLKRNRNESAYRLLIRPWRLANLTPAAWRQFQAMRDYEVHTAPFRPESSTANYQVMTGLYGKPVEMWECGYAVTVPVPDEDVKNKTTDVEVFLPDFATHATTAVKLFIDTFHTIRRAD